MTDSLSFGRLGVLLFGTPEDEIEVRVLEDGTWNATADTLARGGSRRRTLAVEVRGSRRLRPALQQLLAEVDREPVDGLYIAVPGWRRAALVARLLRKRGLRVVDVYGVDPDYYFGIVPITDGGHRAVERFVLGLKLDLDAPARVRAALKRWLIAAGLSARIYESFVIVAEVRACS